ncbi:hypothetical protein [Aquimarina algiphila]|uniref:hypothetical protein n=1 Tax=Aquimarina algiphila TaxID=2047982 RepID=UPI00232C3FB1|nr:hypothetical protein [Aquimarina algiphila]
MKKLTYKVIEDEQTLVYEELYNSKNEVIYYKDYQANPHAEKKITFNDLGLLVEEIDLSDGNELNRLELIYDKNGRNTERNFFFGTDLYEKVITEYSESGHVKTTYQDGEEVNRLVTETKGKNYVSKFYQNEKLIESQFSEYDTVNKCNEIKIYDGDNNLIAIRKETYNHADEVVNIEDVNENGNLLSEHTYEIEKGLTLKEVHRDFRAGESEYNISREYDFNKNLIKMEVRAANNHLIEFYLSTYDDKNRLAEEKGVSNGSFNAIYGSYTNGEEYHFIHKYEN